MKYAKNKDSVVRQVLAYYNRRITYLGDIKKWKVEEKWQTPKLTWLLQTGDCEDGALLIYCTLHWLGIPDEQLYIATGDVEGVNTVNGLTGNITLVDLVGVSTFIVPPSKSA